MSENLPSCVRPGPNFFAAQAPSTGAPAKSPAATGRHVGKPAVVKMMSIGFRMLLYANTT